MTDATDDLEDQEMRRIDNHNYRARMIHDKKWITKDGEILNISDMTTQHIKNCIKMLDREINSIQFELLGDNGGFREAALVNEDSMISKNLLNLNNELKRRK